MDRSSEPKEYRVRWDWVGASLVACGTVLGAFGRMFGPGTFLATPVFPIGQPLWALAALGAVTVGFVKLAVPKSREELLD